MLRNKIPAPAFALPDENGQERSLESLRQGRPFLLLFSRFAACPTSRRDLMAYDNIHSRLQMVGCSMAAITADTVESHRRLHHALGLSFSLLADPGFAVSERYGVYRSDEVEEGPQPHGEPAVFILDVDGNIAYSQVCTGPKGVAGPSEMALMILYMCGNGGRYW